VTARPSLARYVAAWGVHLLTASAAPAGVLAILASARGDYATSFLWMAYTIFSDAIDGTLARAVEVKRVLPWFDGTRLDDLVDYVTYVIVPAFLVLHAGLLPANVAVPVVLMPVVASCYGFCRTDAKTADHFFTGFPSYWNIVAFYLYALGWPPGLNALVLVTLAILVFVPIRYIYPSRTTTLRPLTVGLGIVWAVVMIWLLLHLTDAPRWLVRLSLAYPAYYVGMSLLLHFRRPAETARAA
jgi:phosphatidylcholine synthase